MNFSGALIVYDVTNRSSFDTVRKWNQELNRFAGDVCTQIILGNKADLDDKRKVTDDEATKLAQELKLLHYTTSAKDNKNVFYAIAKLAFECAKVQGLDETWDDDRNEEMVAYAIRKFKNARNGNSEVILFLKYTDLVPSKRAESSFACFPREIKTLIAEYYVALF